MCANFPFLHLAEEVQFGWSNQPSATLHAEMFSTEDREKWALRKTKPRKEEFLVSRTALAKALDPLPLQLCITMEINPNIKQGTSA